MALKTPYQRVRDALSDTELYDRVNQLERMRHERWHYVGDPGEPTFQNGWDNVGGGLTHMRFRRLVAGGVEIQGSVTGGTSGSVVFTLPAHYRHDTELRLAASDDAGGFIVFRVLANGNVIAGV